MAEVRDIVVVVFGAASVVLFLVLLISLLGVWLAVRRLRRVIAELRAEVIDPTVADVRATATGVKAAGTMAHDYVVRPSLVTVRWWLRIRRARKRLARVSDVLRLPVR